MNWLLPGYLSIVMLTAYYFGDKLFDRNKWIKTGIYISLFLVLAGYLIQLVPNAPIGEANTWSGWQDAAGKVYKIQVEKGGKENCFIFGNSYKSASQIKFYLPDKQDTYAENVFGERALQFDYWVDINALKGKNALYVFDNRREYKSRIDLVAKYFDSISETAKYEYNFFGIGKTRTITVYYCEGYHGVE
jgi:hypothetical protein